MSDTSSPSNSDHPTSSCTVSRRGLLRGIGRAGAAALAGISCAGLALPELAFAEAMDKAQRDALTPDQVLHRLLQGNARFSGNRLLRHDYLAQKADTRDGQYPAAIILSCIDSRVPAEIVLDAGIGELFNARVAGNLVNQDILGSMEYACAVAGSKVIMVMGHTGCGAIKGGISGAQLGHLTGLVDRLRPAAEATRYTGVRDEKNPAFVDEVARTHVRMTVRQIRQQSSTLAGMERRDEIMLVGAMYHLRGGRLEVLEA